MKKIFLSTMCLTFCLIVKSQIILEHTLDSTSVPYFYYTDMGGNDFKYVFLNQEFNSFSLFNLDMSPYMTNISIPGGSDSLTQGFTVIYITKSLFDCDSSNIEYVFENPYDTDSKFRIFRTDGALLFQVDSANGPYYLGGGIFGGSNDFKPIANTNNGTKLFLQKYDSNGVPQILIYGLCGSLPESILDFNHIKSYVRIFPNPANRVLNFEIVFPNNQEEYQLLIFDAISKDQLQTLVPLTERNYTLNVSNFHSGTYFYSFVSKNKIYQTGKFIINQ